MNTRQDIHRELFGTIHATEQHRHVASSIRGRLHLAPLSAAIASAATLLAALEQATAAQNFATAARLQDEARAALVTLGAENLIVLYGIDDALV